MALDDEIRTYWNEDAASYDAVPNHAPTDAATRAAWSATLARLLPSPPARILDVGAGTGFLSLIAARLGHKVTALDLSPTMLGRLRAKADAEGLGLDVVEGSAAAPPAGPWDAVMERHVVWTLPSPVQAVRAWREVAPMGRLVLLESLWGKGGDPVEVALGAARRGLGRLRGARGHHAAYPDSVVSSLPYAHGVGPSELVDLVAAAGWPDPWLERLADIEWASKMALPLPERLLGVPARFVITAG